MKFFEFGEGKDKTLLIECGYLAKWNPGLMPFIEEAKKTYHVIVQAYDGFNSDILKSVRNPSATASYRRSDKNINLNLSV